MKIKVTQENLHKTLGIVSRVASGRATLPILANILITAKGNALTVSATNLELAITTTLVGKVEEEGTITVPARLMNDFVSSLPRGTIDLTLDGTSLNITCENYSSTINGMLADEFPSLPELQNTKPLKISTLALKEALQQTVLAASSDEARQVLTGVYIHSHDDNLYFVATDSYRLAEKLVAKTDDDIDLIVPATTLQELLRILGDDDDDIEFTFDEGQVSFRYGDVQIVSRLVEGKFPDYRQLIPAKSDINFTLSRKDFINITKVSSLFARESAGSVTLKVSEEDQQISIRSIASQVGENTSSADANIKGSGEVTLNSRYLLDALNAFDSETINFRFSGKINPCVITSNTAKDNDYVHIVMPLRS